MAMDNECHEKEPKVVWILCLDCGGLGCEECDGYGGWHGWCCLFHEQLAGVYGLRIDESGEILG